MQPFIVKLVGLKPGATHYDWTIAREFFDTFGNSDILKADIDVSVDLHYRGVTADAEVDIRGSVVVSCDRCLEELELKVAVDFEQSYTPEGMELDLSQDIYDYICTSLPLQRIHPDGECNEETIKYLSK